MLKEINMERENQMPSFCAYDSIFNMDVVVRFRLVSIRGQMKPEPGPYWSPSFRGLPHNFNFPTSIPSGPFIGEIHYPPYRLQAERWIIQSKLS